MTGVVYFSENSGTFFSRLSRREAALPFFDVLREEVQEVPFTDGFLGGIFIVGGHGSEELFEDGVRGRLERDRCSGG
jgi:hypothetical protein